MHTESAGLEHVANEAPQGEASARPDPNKQTLTLTIWAPNQTEPRTFVWPKTLKVSEASTEAATAFGIANPSMTKLQKDDESGTILDPHKTLVSERLKDGDSLTLIADGGGV
jgi:hypothetical protein